jgi:histidinol dehydrogenase
LLIEAEHGFDSAALLVTYCEDFAEKALGYLGEYLEKLPPWRKKFCEDGLGSYSGILLTDSLQASLDFINDYAPEHLQVFSEVTHWQN